MEIIQIVDCNNYDGFQQLDFIFSSKFVHYFIAYLMTKLTLGVEYIWHWNEWNHLLIHLIYLGLLYTRCQGWENLGPTLSIFGLLFGPKLLINAVRILINAGTLAPKSCKLTFQIGCYPFASLGGPIQGHQVEHLLVTWGRLIFFFLLFQPWLLV
jgi:hypothetical protein